MKDSQEDYAKELYRDLTRRFANNVPAIAVSIEGAGVNWHCTAKRGRNLCSVACFDAGGPEYLTSFERDAEKVATGRTSSKLDTVKAVDDWIRGQALSRLYDRFRFVDQIKRTLTGIRDEMIASVPALAEVAPGELQHSMCDIYYLWFRGLDRSCQVSFYGNNELPDAVFHWDGCELFRFQTGEGKYLAAVLKRWLCDRAMPSALRSEFPEIEIGELADYYERGNPIEGEFLMSWDSIDRFYDRLHFPFVPKVRGLVAQMREKGYDRSLRAGQSLSSLIVSRSRRHGLRDDQPFIEFGFSSDGMEVYFKIGEETKVKCPEIKLTPEIDTLLKKLEAKGID
jgi:hypothetical protein